MLSNSRSLAQMSLVLRNEVPSDVAIGDAAPGGLTWLGMLGYLILLCISFKATRWGLKHLTKIIKLGHPEPPVEEDFTPSSALSLEGLGRSRFQHQDAVNLAPFVTRRRAAVWDRLRANSEHSQDILVLD